MIEFMQPNEKQKPFKSILIQPVPCTRQMGIEHHKMHSTVKSSFCTALEFAVTLTMAVFNIISTCFGA